MASPFTSCLGPNGKSLVFYVNKHGFLKQWQQKNKCEMLNSEGRNEYDDVEMLVGKSPIKPSSKDLGCLWVDRDIPSKGIVGQSVKFETHIRLYYSDEQNKICELCYDIDRKTKEPTGGSKGGVWYQGKLSSYGWKTMKDSPISAHFNGSPDDRCLKVYFVRGDARPGDRPTVAWYSIADDKEWKLLDEDYEI